MDTSAAVTVVCDRCHRPGWQLTVSAVTGDVIIQGVRAPEGAGGDPRWAAVLAAGPVISIRPGASREAQGGAFIVPADPAGGHGGRVKLLCIGRRHPRYERAVTEKSAERAYREAVAAGRDRIGMCET